MPSDSVHVKWAYRIGTVTALGLFVLADVGIEYIILMFGIYMFATKYMSPDLDLDSEPYQRWGLLKLFMSPFKDKVKHRSKWSHHWLLGWITINVYVTVVFAVIITVLNLVWLPAIEPAIDLGQAFSTRVVTLDMTAGDWAAVGMIYACTFYAHIGHTTVDKVFTGDRQA